MQLESFYYDDLPYFGDVRYRETHNYDGFVSEEMRYEAVREWSEVIASAMGLTHERHRWRGTELFYLKDMTDFFMKARYPFIHQFNPDWHYGRLDLDKAWVQLNGIYMLCSWLFNWTYGFDKYVIHNWIDDDTFALCLSAEVDGIKNYPLMTTAYSNYTGDHIDLFSKKVEYHLHYDDIIAEIGKVAGGMISYNSHNLELYLSRCKVRPYLFPNGTFDGEWGYSDMSGLDVLRPDAEGMENVFMNISSFRNHQPSKGLASNPDWYYRDGPDI